MSTLISKKNKSLYPRTVFMDDEMVLLIKKRGPQISRSFSYIIRHCVKETIKNEKWDVSVSQEEILNEFTRRQKHNKARKKNVRK